QLEPGLDHVCAVRVRLPVRVRRPFDCRAACVRNRRADALRVTTILRKLPLFGHPEGNCDRCGQTDAFRQEDGLITAPIAELDSTQSLLGKVLMAATCWDLERGALVAIQGADRGRRPN